MTDQNPQREGMERMQARYDGGGKTLLCPAGFPVPEGTKEWELIPGPKGDRGPKGDKGDRGMPPGQRRAIVYLFVLPVLIAAIALGGLAYYAHRLSVEQQEIIRVATLNNRVRCASIAEIVSIPIPVPTAGNPSREWDAKYEEAERARGLQLGCRLPPPRYAQSGP